MKTIIATLVVIVAGIWCVATILLSIARDKERERRRKDDTTQG